MHTEDCQLHFQIFVQHFGSATVKGRLQSLAHMSFSYWNPPGVFFDAPFPCDFVMHREDKTPITTFLFNESVRLTITPSLGLGTTESLHISLWEMQNLVVKPWSQGHQLLAEKNHAAVPPEGHTGDHTLCCTTLDIDLWKDKTLFDQGS